MRINKPIYLIVHHTGGSDTYPLADSSNQTFEDVNREHRNNPRTWLGEYSSLGYAIGYHYFIDKQGKLTQGRSDLDEGAHAVGHNTDSLGICLAGNFDLTMPTVEQITSLKAILGRKMAEYSIPASNIFPHRHFANKSCYGNNLPDNWASQLMSTTSKPVEPCQDEKSVIIEQEKKISNLQVFINNLIKFFNLK